MGIEMEHWREMGKEKIKKLILTVISYLFYPIQDFRFNKWKTIHQSFPFNWPTFSTGFSKVNNLFCFSSIIMR